MDSIKQAIVTDIQNHMAALPERGLGGHPDAEVEYGLEGGLVCSVVVRHPSCEDGRTFEIRVSEVRRP